MFSHNHYVPVLRWKQGEIAALHNLYEQDRSRVTPLIELVPSDFTEAKIRKCGGLNDKLEKTVDQIRKALRVSPFFVDLGLLTGLPCESQDAKHLLEILGDHVRHTDSAMIPVTGIDRPQKYQSAVKALAEKTKERVCLRLTPTDLRRPNCPQKLNDLLNGLDVSPSQAHLIIDLQLVNGFHQDLKDLSTRIPSLSKWITFTIIGGAFPPDLTDYDPGEHEVERSDWLTWREHVVTEPKLPRIPTYGDYTTRHPVFFEPPPGVRVSASIRYTADEYWVVMRGEWVNKPGGSGHKQYQANAVLLRERPEFSGAEFSEGDRYIAQMDLRSSKTGNATTWVQASVNHHMTFTVRQIADLFAP